MSYRAPVKDMLFAIKELADIDAVAALPGFEDAGYDTAHGGARGVRPSSTRACSRR